MPALDSEKRVGVVPDGVVVSPEAEQFLGRALDALRSGLSVSAWMWAARAAAVLDEVTEGAAPDVENVEKSR